MTSDRLGGLRTVAERWTCPACGLYGQTAAGLEDDTCLLAHAAVSGCDLSASPAPEWTAAGRPAPPPGR